MRTANKNRLGLAIKNSDWLSIQEFTPADGFQVFVRRGLRAAPDGEPVKLLRGRGPYHRLLPLIRTCLKCEQSKPIDQYAQNGSNRSRTCKACRRAPPRPSSRLARLTKYLTILEAEMGRIEDLIALTRTSTGGI